MEAIMRSVMLLALAALLAGCTQTAHLYPINPAAQATGPLVVTYEDTGFGTGSCSVRLPDGEVLTGRYQTASGATHGTAMSGGQMTSVTMFSSGPQYGTATLVGTRGTRMDCEYMSGGSVMGTCTTSFGGQYRLHD
jgi:hypothetical protein